MRARLVVFVGLTLVGSPALGAQHLVPTKVFLVKNPSSGARKVLWKVKEPGSAATVTGDPTADGATLRIQLMLGGDQCVSLPAAGWSAVGSLGFKYKDAALANGPVKKALIKKTASGTLLIKALLKTGGPTDISVLPGDPTTTYATNLALGTGDDYCGGTSTATPDPNDATTFKVTDDGAPAGEHIVTIYWPAPRPKGLPKPASPDPEDSGQLNTVDKLGNKYSLVGVSKLRARVEPRDNEIDFDLPPGSTP